MSCNGSQQESQMGRRFWGICGVDGVSEWPLCPCLLPHTHFHVVHVDDVPTVIQVLLQVLVLKREDRGSHPVWPSPNFPRGLTATQPYQVLKDKGEGLLRVDNVM